MKPSDSDGSIPAGDEQEVSADEKVHINLRVSVSSINWPLLRKQKKALFNLATGSRVTQEERDLLEGVLSLLDSLQDEAAALVGDRVIFGHGAQERT